MSSIVVDLDERPLSNVTGYRLAVVLHSGGACVARCQVLAEGYTDVDVEERELGRAAPPNLYSAPDQDLPKVRTGKGCSLKITNANGQTLTLTDFDLEGISQPCSSGCTNFTLFSFHGLVGWDVTSVLVSQTSLGRLSSGKLSIEGVSKPLRDIVCTGDLVSWSCDRGANSDGLGTILAARGSKNWGLPLQFRWNEDAGILRPTRQNPQFVLFEELTGRFGLLPFWKESELRDLKHQQPTRLNDRLTKIRLDDVIDRRDAGSYNGSYSPDDSVVERVYALFDQDVLMA